MERSLQRGAIGVNATLRSTGMRLSMPILSRQYVRHQSSAFNITQLSFWKYLIPKPFRPRPKPTVDWGVPGKKKVKSEEWNPATFYIIIFLFIGSMSIQMIALRREFATFTRRAEVRIGLLREVIEKIQRGEEVDVGKALGAGNAEKELAWEEVLREIEQDDTMKGAKKAVKPKTTAPISAAAESKPVSASGQGVGPTKSATSYSSFF